MGSGLWRRGLALGAVGSMGLIGATVARAELMVVYPPAHHTTTADRIFFVGTADPDQPVLINGEPIQSRSPAGHFAPSLPLTLGVNRFTLTQGQERLEITIDRQPPGPILPDPPGLVTDSLQPQGDRARPAGELICLGAMGPATAQVTVTLAGRQLTLAPQPAQAQLPANAGVLINQVEPLSHAGPTLYQGCLSGDRPGDLGQPTYTLAYQGRNQTATAPGRVIVLSRDQPQVVAVTAAPGVARTGPSTDYSRLTPLPQGTRATVIAQEGEWLQLDYGGWIRASETAAIAGAIPPQSLVRGVTSRRVEGWTEVHFPLQVPVPVTVQQTQDSFTLTLHNTTAQTDTIRLVADGVLDRLDWQPLPNHQVQYQFHFKTPQQWGYRLDYRGPTLVLALRHPPRLGSDAPLQGATILLDAGHGGDELGARGPDGTPEKAITLAISTLLQQALEARGATVIMTRQDDSASSPNDRANQITATAPTLALSLHYNALPDAGDALHTAGVGAFWFHAQARDLAQFLHDYLVDQLDRPSYGVYWNNLALTRPAVSPAVLLELGFMTNPGEFEWVQDPETQQEVADTLAAGLTEWLHQAGAAPGEEVSRRRRW